MRSGLKANSHVFNYYHLELAYFQALYTYGTSQVMDVGRRHRCHLLKVVLNVTFQNISLMLIILFKTILIEKRTKFESQNLSLKSIECLHNSFSKKINRFRIKTKSILAWNSTFVRFILWNALGYDYRKIASSNTSRLEAHVGFFRLLMKGIFGPYVLWPFDKNVIF